MSLLIQLELALHDADCPGHEADFVGHGDKYTKLAHAAAAVFPPEREPYWLQDRKLIQEIGLNQILDGLTSIKKVIAPASDIPETVAYLKMLINPILPDSTIAMDNDRQLIIYTDLQEDTNGKLIPHI